MKTEKATLIFDALSQETRLRVFRILVKNSKNGITPTEIAEQMNNMPRNTLSFHLNLLTAAELCSFEKKGKQVIYKPVCSAIEKVAEFLLRDCCDKGCKC